MTRSPRCYSIKIINNTDGGNIWWPLVEILLHHPYKSLLGRETIDIFQMHRAAAHMCSSQTYPSPSPYTCSTFGSSLGSVLKWPFSWESQYAKATLMLFGAVLIYMASPMTQIFSTYDTLFPDVSPSQQTTPVLSYSVSISELVQMNGWWQYKSLLALGNSSFYPVPF